MLCVLPLIAVDFVLYSVIIEESSRSVMVRYYINDTHTHRQTRDTNIISITWERLYLVIEKYRSVSGRDKKLKPTNQASQRYHDHKHSNVSIRYDRLVVTLLQHIYSIE